MKKKLLVIMLAIAMVMTFIPVLTMTASAAEVASGTSGDVNWTLTDEGTLTISGTGAMEDWGMANDVPWYGSRTSIKKIVIEDGVTSIGACAFYEYSNLTEVTIGSSVESIGNSAFYMCSSLTSVTIPDSVTRIGDGAFFGCIALTSVTIGNSVESIGFRAFYKCSALTSVTIPNSVKSIGGSAFEKCSALASVEIGNSVESIDDSAFQDCSNLTSVDIGDSVKNIGNYAFYGCSNLASAEIPDSVTGIGNYAFSGCSSLTSVDIGDSVENIGNYAFSGCSNLTSVDIGNSVTTIGADAFRGCSKLTSVKIPDSVTTIGPRAFYDCSNLTSVTLGNSVTLIHVNAFSNTNLQTVNAPCNYRLEGEFFYNGNTQLSNIPGTVTITIAPHVASDTGNCVCGYNPIESVTVTGNKTSWDYAPDATATLTVDVTLKEGYTATTTTYTWTKNDTEIPPVSESTLIIHGINAGEWSYICTVIVDGYKMTGDVFVVTVNKAASFVTAAPTPNTLIYAGEAQNLISAGEAMGGTMVYSLTENGEYTTTIPRGTNVGDYTVWYYVQGDENHNDSAKDSVNVTIEKTTPLKMHFNYTFPADLTYNGEEKAITVTVKDGIVGMGDFNVWYKDSFNNRVQGAPINAGTYDLYIEVTEGDNYEAETVEAGYYIIEKATPVLTEPTAIEDLIYNGDSQALVSAGSTTGGTLKYGMFVGEYDSSVVYGPVLEEAAPTATNVGPYIVFYMVEGGDNYEDVAMQHITVTVEKAKPTLDVKAPVTSVLPGNTILLSYTLTGVKGEALTNAVVIDSAKIGTLTCDIDGLKVTVPSTAVIGG